MLNHGLTWYDDKVEIYAGRASARSGPFLGPMELPVLGGVTGGAIAELPQSDWSRGCPLIRKN
jgi:hypothetical protein